MMKTGPAATYVSSVPFSMRRFNTKAVSNGLERSNRYLGTNVLSSHIQVALCGAASEFGEAFCLEDWANTWSLQDSYLCRYHSPRLQVEHTSIVSSVQSLLDRGYVLDQNCWNSRVMSPKQVYMTTCLAPQLGQQAITDVSIPLPPHQV